MSIAHCTQTFKQFTNATIFIVLLCLNTGATGQIVYKCGSSYSQTPCLGAQAIQVDDARTAAQKKQTDTAVHRDAQQAQSLEKLRLAQEKAARKQRSDVAPNTNAVTAHTSPVDANGVVHTMTPKRMGVKHHKPDAFVAEIPGSKPQAGVKKPVRKKPVQPAASSPT